MPKSTITNSLLLKGESSLVGLPEIAGALHLVDSQNALDRVAREIIEIARRARLSRDMKLCSEASSVLLSLPASQGLRSVAEFYCNLSCPTVTSDTTSLRQAVIRSADGVAAAYVPRVILEIGRAYDREGDFPEALRYYVDAARCATRTDPIVAAQAAEYAALLLSDDGNHIEALRRLEHLWPVVATISCRYSHVYYAYLNNLAVVLSRAGRTQESRIAIGRALSSPLARRFPEWLDTEKEIEEAAQKEPQRRPAAAAAVPTPAARARTRKAPTLVGRQPRSTFAILVTRVDQTGAVTPLLRRNGHAVCSVLERYVKTVRIRDSP